MDDNKNNSAIFEANINKVPDIMDFVLTGAKEGGVAGKRLSHLELALEEILVNIVNYAYETPPGEIIAQTQNEENCFKVNIIDNGRHFDPLSVDFPDTKTTLEERPVGGLGIMLIRNIIDEVHYMRAAGQNKITFVVYLNK